ncbi:16293_t:CDS:2, partial [Acaulospora morrowiae]
SRKTDQTMLDAFNKKYSEHSSFRPTGKSLNSLPTFGIQHFFGQVTYSSTGFLEKNIDNLSADFVSLFRDTGGEIAPSNNGFITDLFTDKAFATESHPRNGNTIVAAQQSVKPMRAPSMRRKKNTPASDESSIPKVTCVAAQVASALNELCETLEETQPWYVFCIRPNDTQLPNQFDQRVVNSQVKSFGLPEIAKRLQVEYVVSYQHQEFIERYATILDSMGLERYEDSRAKCEAVGKGFGWEDTDAVIGQNKIYLSERSWRKLEDDLRSMDSDDKRRKKEKKTPVVSSNDYARSEDQLYQNQHSSNQDLLEKPRRASPPRNYDQRSFHSGDDNRSNLSEDDYYQDEAYSTYDDNTSTYGSDVYAPSRNMFMEMERKNMLPDEEKMIEEEPEEPRVTTPARKKWVFLTWLLTWWIPSCFLSCCGMKRKDVRMAWREKVALCIVILFLSCVVIFVLAFLGLLICPRVYIFNDSEVQSHNFQDSPDSTYVSIRGEVYLLSSFAPRHYPPLIDQKSILAYGGTDATKLFPVQVSALCSGTQGSVDPS